MYKLAICDDDTYFRISLEKFLREFFSAKDTEYSIASFSEPSSFNVSLNAGADYDLVFLDIMFENDNGIDYAKSLRANHRELDIVFITTSKEYAIESFDVHPLYYILKPMEPQKLTAALERFLEKSAPIYICFNSLGSTIKIELSDILYFEIYGHRVIIHKTDGTSSDIRGTLKDIESQLPPATFIRPHRSYLVNFRFVTEIDHYSLKIKNGEILPISKALYNKIQFEFVDYLDKNDLFI